MTGWVIYDNKNHVVRSYEPFYSTGLGYAVPAGAELGQHQDLYYDPPGRNVRTVNPDGSQTCIVYGVPGTIAAPDLTNPALFEPTPWETYTYDPNDNAGRTDPAGSAGLPVALEHSRQHARPTRSAASSPTVSPQRP